MKLYSCLSVLAQRWLEPEKPLKKQIKGTWLTPALENSPSIFREGFLHFQPLIILYMHYFYCLNSIPVQHLSEKLSPAALWAEIATNTLVIFNWVIFLGRSRIALLSELQSAILHLWSQLAAAWADKVSRCTRACVCVQVHVCAFSPSACSHEEHTCKACQSPTNYHIVTNIFLIKFVFVWKLLRAVVSHCHSSVDECVYWWLAS